MGAGQQTFRAGETIIAEGSNLRLMYQVARGSVCVVKSREKQSEMDADTVGVHARGFRTRDTYCFTIHWTRRPGLE